MQHQAGADATRLPLQRLKREPGNIDGSRQQRKGCANRLEEEVKEQR